jgi:tRNA(Ile)-lysidine synthase
MANLKKLPANRVIPQQLTAFLRNVFVKQDFNKKRLANPALVLALSGGVDSIVLLHALSISRKTLPFKLSAHHVHHGLSVNADAWADFCTDFCQKLTIPLTVSHVKINKNNGLGIEAAAREARYAALQTDTNSWLCLAHHQDDQAETLLLQLARGAGVKGLAGMAAVDVKRKMLRPLLDISRAEIEAYATQNNLNFVVDESNADTQFDRNFMRHEILPTLQKQYPSVAQTLARSAQNMAAANDLLDELAQSDFLNANSSVGLQPQGLSPRNIPAEAGYSCVKPSIHAPLSLVHLSTLSENRINNCLRWWLGINGLQMPSHQLLQQISQQLMHAKLDANIAIKVSDNLTLRRYQQRAYLVQDYAPNAPINLLWQGEDGIILPNKTKLIFSKQMGQGVSLRKIENAKLRIKFREGSERFLPELGRPRRSLKVMLQNHKMPPWQREQLPLIFMDETLVIIPNVGVDAGLQAGNDEIGIIVEWKVVE